MRRAREWPALGRRWQQVLLLAAITGMLTGATVALFEEVTNGILLTQVTTAPLWVQTAGPLAGLLIATASLRWLGRRASPSTSDEYIKNFHDRERRLPLRAVPARILASVATLGLGGPLGYEGPSIYLGAAIGSGLQRRLARFFSRDDAKVLLVAGAAAGVAAIFKAPATGAIFALEVPYQEDLARRMLLPALIAAAVSYITYAAFQSTAPILPVKGAPPFNLVDIGGAVIVGLYGRSRGPSVRLAAAPGQVDLADGSRLAPCRRRRRRPGRTGPRPATPCSPSRSPWARGTTPCSGRPTRATAWAWSSCSWSSGRPRSTPPSPGAVPAACSCPSWSKGPCSGASAGRCSASPAARSSPSSASPRSSAPATGFRWLRSCSWPSPPGRPAFVVPGLVAAVVAQLVMGRRSVSAYQQAGRGGHLERRFSIPLTQAVSTDVRTIPPDATVADFSGTT